MADIDEMVDGLDDAAKKAGKADDWQAAACRQAAAFKALQPILIAAMQQSDRVESQLSDFLKTAPKLAKRLAHWQAANPRPPIPSSTQPRSKAGAFSVCEDKWPAPDADRARLRAQAWGSW
jgi:hypothetical protein